MAVQHLLEYGKLCTVQLCETRAFERVLHPELRVELRLHNQPDLMQ
jgi:hypothetical protein